MCGYDDYRRDLHACGYDDVEISFMREIHLEPPVLDDHWTRMDDRRHQSNLAKVTYTGGSYVA